MPSLSVDAAGVVILCFIVASIATIVVHDFAWQRRYETLRTLYDISAAGEACAQRWQAAAEYILSQKGDDLCWRDFYVKLAECLPDGHRLKHLASIKSLPSTPVMLRNCRRFVASLKCVKPYVRFNDQPLRESHMPPIRAVELIVRCSRRRDDFTQVCGPDTVSSLPIARHPDGWEVDTYVTSALIPIVYASSEIFQDRMFDRLNAIAETIDAAERGFKEQPCASPAK